MTFRVIKGGRPPLPQHRQGQQTPAENARCEVIDRVAAAIHTAGTEDMAGYPTWQDFVDAAYENMENNPGMLASVSNTYQQARAAVAALSPPEPCFDEDIALAVSAAIRPTDPVMVVEAVTAWVDEVLK